MLKTILEDILRLQAAHEDESFLSMAQKAEMVDDLARKAKDMQAALDAGRVNFNQVAEYWFFWLSGGYANTLAESPQSAFTKLGYSGSVINLVDFYDIVPEGSASVNARFTWPNCEEAADAFFVRVTGEVEKYIRTLPERDVSNVIAGMLDIQVPHKYTDRLKDRFKGDIKNE